MTTPNPNSEENLAIHFLRAALSLLESDQQTPVDRRRAMRLLTAALALLEV